MATYESHKCGPQVEGDKLLPRRWKSSARLRPWDSLELTQGIQTLYGNSVMQTKWRDVLLVHIGMITLHSMKSMRTGFPEKCRSCQDQNTMECLDRRSCGPKLGRSSGHREEQADRRVWKSRA